MADDNAADNRRKDTRWKKGGASPNPHGRRGKPKAAGSAPSKALDQPISHKLNGKLRRTTVRERMALQLARQALDDDKKALKMLLDWEKAARTESKTETSSTAAYPLNEDDLRTIDAICQRIRASKPPEGQS